MRHVPGFDPGWRGCEDERQRPWILYLTGSPIRVGDDRGGIGMKIANDNPKLSFLLPLCHSCSPSVIPTLSLSVIPAKAGIQSCGV